MQGIPGLSLFAHAHLRYGLERRGDRAVDSSRARRRLPRDRYREPAPPLLRGRRRRRGDGAIRDGVVRRDELFLQTKFTSVGGQDRRLPYDPHADPATQVRQSFASSLEHLQVEAIDSYVLHGPSRSRGLSQEDIAVWRAMESLPVRALGVSNVALDQLEALFELAAVKPAFVQNRCFAATRWDAAIRAFCRAHDIVYQGFSLLTANLNELRSAAFREIVQRTRRTPAQVVFRFARQVGMLPLTGTTDPAHMREDLAIDDFELSADDVARIERIAG